MPRCVSQSILVCQEWVMMGLGSEFLPAVACYGFRVLLCLPQDSWGAPAYIHVYELHAEWAEGLLCM